MKTRTLSMIALLGAAVLLAGAAACSPPTADSQKARYQRAKDKLDALATTSPTMREGIQAKLVEFDRDFKAAEAKGGEAAAKDMGQVCQRMEDYALQLSPPAAASTTPGTPGTPGAATVPGGKLGATTPAPVPAAPVPAAPATGSGFGGTTPAVTPPPPAPTPPPATGSGFGGQ
jgi:hypothetical protein